ncbi:hypothetical protein OAP72_03045, partial [Flavobacteriaceae bacterium]|nr:hypothetical protein [Flavobacteriaceae bacterium]
MKKLIYLFLTVLIVACSDDEGNPCLYNPTLTTSAVTNITETAATLNGVISIVSENCDDPNNTEQGFVYATTIQPTTANNKVNVNGTDISTTLETLEPNTTYYARTFLTNVFGEFYGNEVSFITGVDQSCEYNLITLETTDITSSSATLNGTISIDEENCEFPIIEQGFVFSTEVQPTIADTQVNVNGTEVTTTIENLEPSTTYYVRTFLTNNDGEFYGNEVSFMTEIRLDFSTAFTFESSGFIIDGTTGMVGSSAENSLFIAMRETDQNSAERILKVNLATNNITEKLFEVGQLVTKRLHIRGNQLIVFAGQYVNTYNLDLSGGDPTSVSHGKQLTRFGMTVLDDNAYIIGGDYGAEFEVEAKKIFRWNIETETFSEFTALPETRYGANGTIVDDNLYVFGGRSQFTDYSTALTTAYKININNPSNVETFEIDKTINPAFVRRFQNLIYIAGPNFTIDASDETIAFNPIVAVYNTSDNTYQELNTNLINTSGFDTIHQMCIVNGKMYIIYGGQDNGG